MRLFAAMDTSASALTAERLRMEVIANNLANAETTRTPGGGPYRRQMPVFAPRPGASPFARFLGRFMGGRAEAGEGVKVVGIAQDATPFKLRYDPGHPDADPQGYVQLPNVDVVKEMVDLVAAGRAYEGNVTALDVAKQMAQRALEIGRV